MKITSAKNLVWNDAQHTSFDCLVTLEEFGEAELPFTCRADDSEAHAQALWATAMNGDYGVLAEP